MATVESVETPLMIARECRQMVLSQGRAGAVATMAVAALFVFVLRDVHPGEYLIGWAVAVSAASALRIWLSMSWARQPAANDDSRAGTPLVCILLGAICGGVWGVASTWLFPMGHTELYFVIAFLLISMPAAAISSFGAWWPAYTAYVLCNIAPFALYFLFSGQADFIVVGVAACFFTAFLLRQGFVISRTIQRNIAQRIALLSMTQSLGDALDRADAANRAKSTFLANMSHELRTPLNVIIGMSQLLAEDPDVPQHRHLPNSIRRAGQSLLALISDVLDLSQIEAGKITLQIASFSPRQLVEDVLDMFEPEAMSKSLRLDAVCSGSVPERFIGDQARLRQILVNLVSNAIKFTAVGNVRIEFDLDFDGAAGRTLLIDVIDTGPGIPQSDHLRIFSAFQQGDDSMSRAHPGTGLGLNISRDLIALMGGRIELRSAPGVGSRFRVRVPELIAPAGAVTDASFVSETPQPLLAGVMAVSIVGLRILVVEDNMLNAMLVKLMLERNGCVVECAGNGVDALQKMKSEPWRVVLMDCQMPGMDGYATTRQWREIEALEHRTRLPILALTAHAMADDRRKCLDAGMDDYLTKPVKLESLRAVLSRLVEAGHDPGHDAGHDAARPHAGPPSP